MEILLSITIIGIVATAAMNCFLWLLSGLTETHCDMVRGVGSLYTHEEKTALVPGLIMQFTAGLIMAYVYGVFLERIHCSFAYQYAGLGILMGLVHGLAVSIVLKKLLSEHHPVDTYQEVTYKVFFAHVFAHMIYGLVIGTMYGTYLAF